MHAIAIASAAALLTLSEVAPAAPGGPFHSVPGGYTVRFPAAPTESVKDRGGVKLHMDRAAAAGGAATYLVSWGDYFPEVRYAAERVFDDEIRALARAGARIVEQGPASAAGARGRAFRGVMADGKALHGRVLLHDTRVFMLLVAAPEATASDAAREFFASFALPDPGVPDPPTPPTARRVPFPEARVSLELHGAPDRSELSGGPGAGVQLAARSRGGFRVEIATYVPGQAKTDRERRATLDGFVAAFRPKSGTVSEQRDLVTAGGPARQFRTTIGTGDAVVRIVLLERGALMLQLIGPAGTVDAREAEAFFESARLESAGK